MAKMKMLMNPSARTWLHCEKCGQTFSTPIQGRTKCVHCKPTTRKELMQLLNFEGGKIVQSTSEGSQRLVV